MHLPANSALSVRLDREIGAPWLAMSAITLGEPGRGESMANLFGLVECDGQPVARIDIHDRLVEQAHTATAAMMWKDRAVIGVGWDVHVVTLATRAVLTYRAPSYVESMVVTGDSLLIVFGTGLALLDPSGTIAWTNETLAADGVRLTSVADGVVHGVGEWDPPGDWRPFAVRLRDGRRI